MAQKILFAIVFIGRQGSSFLQGLLDSHPDARCEGELLSPGGSYFAACGHDDVGRYLKEFLHADPRRAVGFKLPWMSLLDHPEIWEVLERCGYKLIVLTRENLLDQYISMILAQKNDAWRSDYGKIRIKQFVADFDDAERMFRSWSGQNEMLRRAMRSFPSIHVTYERLLDGSGIGAVLDFLDLPPVSLESRFKGQRSGSQSEIILNYGAMKAHFAGTRWARHFVDEPAGPDADASFRPSGAEVLFGLWASARRRMRAMLRPIVRLGSRPGNRGRS